MYSQLPSDTPKDFFINAISDCLVYWNKAIPVNIQSIIFSIGIQFEYILETNKNHLGEIDFKDGQFIFKINPKLDYLTSLFALAHLLGRYYQIKQRTHSEQINYPQIIYKNILSLDCCNQHEINANLFALDILIPEFHAHYLVKNKPEFTLKKYGRNF